MSTAIASSQSPAVRIDVAPLRRPDHADYLTLLDLITDGESLPAGVDQILALPPFQRPFTHGPALCLTAHPRRSPNPKPVGAVFASLPEWAYEHPLCQSDPALSDLLAHTVISIHGVAVAAHRRRQGIARALLTQAEDRARDAGYRLSTLIHKPELAPFYQRLGYATARHITVVVPPDAALGTTQPHAFMTAVKPLARDVHVRELPGAPGLVVTGLWPGSDLPPTAHFHSGRLIA
ncbi:GNAT family N-acetyltransferase [Streptomyces bobili]|uniref:GNAT family N-acetyltransferase n=1 Tax=Streptomyces bobili TaxID=67280 RepID=UPI00379D9485